MKRTEVYLRDFSANEDPRPDAPYKFFPANEDTIIRELKEHFLTSDNSGYEFQHIETQPRTTTLLAQFRISVSKLPPILTNPTYQRAVIVQVSPPRVVLPKELTDILEAHKFNIVKPNPNI